MAAVKKATSVPAEKLRLYEKLVAKALGGQSQSNFGAAYTAVNGNMFSMISKYGVVGIRLPEPLRAAFLEKYDADVFRADPKWPPIRNMSPCRTTYWRRRPRSRPISRRASNMPKR